MQEYNPKRIERTIRRFENDKEDIRQEVSGNLDEIGKRMRAIEKANNEIAELSAQNKDLNREWTVIDGKIKGLQMVLKDEIDPEQ